VRLPARDTPWYPVAGPSLFGPSTRVCGAGLTRVFAMAIRVRPGFAARLAARLPSRSDSHSKKRRNSGS